MKRSSYLKYDEGIQLGKRGLTVWGYGKTGKFACRVEINGAGIAIFTGPKGQKKLANVSWENVVTRLSS